MFIYLFAYTPFLVIDSLHGCRFTKNQKRASLLLSDMSQSIANVLAPAPSPSTTPNSSLSVNSSVSGTPSGLKISKLSLPLASPNPSTSGSLLDDEDEETTKFGTAVLQPVPNPSTPAVENKVAEEEVRKEGGGDHEDWDWDW